MGVGGKGIRGEGVGRREEGGLDGGREGGLGGGKEGLEGEKGAWRRELEAGKKGWKRELEGRREKKGEWRERGFFQGMDGGREGHLQAAEKRLRFPFP